MRTVSDRMLAHDRNNFDVIRLAAALLVLWSHSYPLTGHGGDDIFSKLLSGYDYGGSLAVQVFFVISGFLVARSLCDRGVVGFAGARFLRVIPGLAFATLVTVFLIGPLLTKMPVTAYFKDPSTFTYLRNITVFDLHYPLADTTAGLPHGDTINGSLWSLIVECSFYIVLAVVGVIGLFSPTFIALGAIAVTAVYLYCVYALGFWYDHQGAMLWRGIGVFLVLKSATAFLIVIHPQ